MDNDSITAYASQAQFAMYCNANGVSMRCSRKINASGGRVHKRGRVEGFSRASARRLRHLLYSVDYASGIAVTLTHPIVMDGMRGPEAAFVSLQMVAKRKPWLRSLIWRKEVQRSGTPHYHCILFPSDGVDGVEAAEMLVGAWIDACMTGWRVPDVFVEAQRADMFKAHHDKRRPSIVRLNASSYIRYLLDHQSKHKKEQAATKGRAWGVWLRSGLPRIEGFEQVLTDAQYWRVARILRKASRYTVKASCVFGSKHTSGRRAYAFGATDYFARRTDGNLARQALAFALGDNEAPVEDRMAAGRYFRMQFEHDGPL